MTNQLIYDGMLTVRLPGQVTAQDVYRAIQDEIIRPLFRLLGDASGACVIAGEGVTTAHCGRHGHVLLICNKQLPLIDSRADPAGYARIRGQLAELSRLRGGQIGSGRNAVELRPIITQIGSVNYINDHYSLYPDTQRLEFGQRQLERLYRQMQAA